MDGPRPTGTRDFILLLRTPCNLKLLHWLFLEFSVSYFQTTVVCWALRLWQARLQVWEGHGSGFLCIISRGKAAEHMFMYKSVSLGSVAANPRDKHAYLYTFTVAKMKT